MKRWFYIAVVVAFGALARGWAAEPNEPNASDAQSSPLSVTSRAPTLEEVLKLRDPFKMPNLAALRSGGGARTELEQFNLTDYKILGVITGPGRVRAMIQGPNNKTYFVKQGQKIGTQNGVIKAITPESIVVHEQIVNLLGNKETLVTELRLAAGKKVDVIGGSSASAQTGIEEQEPQSNPMQDPPIPMAPPAPAPVPNSVQVEAPPTADAGGTGDTELSKKLMRAIEKQINKDLEKKKPTEEE